MKKIKEVCIAIFKIMILIGGVISFIIILFAGVMNIALQEGPFLAGLAVVLAVVTFIYADELNY